MDEEGGVGVAAKIPEMQICFVYPTWFLHSILNSALPSWLPICAWLFCILQMEQQFNFESFKF